MPRWFLPFLESPLTPRQQGLLVERTITGETDAFRETVQLQQHGDNPVYWPLVQSPQPPSP